MTLTATKVTTKWETKRTQEKAAEMFATIYGSANEAIAKHAPKAKEEFETLVRQHRVEYLKKVGVKTPLELVKALAEVEHNVFGSEIEIAGDDNKASMKYLNCAMWNATQKLFKFTPEQEKEMGESCQHSQKLLAKEFGFNVEIKMDKDNFEVIYTK